MRRRYLWDQGGNHRSRCGSGALWNRGQVDGGIGWWVVRWFGGCDVLQDSTL